MMKSIRHGGTLVAVAAVMQLASWSGYADPSSGLPVLEEPTVTGDRNDDAQTVRVSYADLKLSSAAGMETLQQRISGAVKTVCGDRADIRITRETRAQRDCQEDAWDRAMAQVDHAVSEVTVAAR